jgi:hypothetical protein
MAQMNGVHGAQKMAAFDQHVGRKGQLMALAGCPNGTVITHTNVGLARWTLEEAFNQVKFTHGAELNRKSSGRIETGSMQCAPGG